MTLFTANHVSSIHVTRVPPVASYKHAAIVNLQLIDLFILELAEAGSSRHLLFLRECCFSSRSKLSCQITIVERRQRHQCKECGGASICQHRRQRSGCGGSGICEHQRHHSICKKCGGSSVCQQCSLRNQWCILRWCPAVPINERPQ